MYVRIFIINNNNNILLRTAVTQWLLHYFGVSKRFNFSGVQCTTPYLGDFKIQKHHKELITHK